MWRARGPRRFERQRASVRGTAAAVGIAAIAMVATLALPATRALAEPLVVVVRDGGDAALAVARLRGQAADLEVELVVVPGAVEPGLDAQLATAARLARTRGARVVVWFVARGRGLAVAIATPADHRLFVREIPAADASAVAEAAAVAARGALRAIGEGGTIGVEVAVLVARSEPPPPVAPRRFGLELAVGWQVALDAGADAGAHAIAQRTRVTRGAWAASLGLTLGPALRRAIDPEMAPGLAIELSRSTGMFEVERRFGAFALGASAGVLVVHRTTVATSGELAPTPAATTTAFVAGPVARWRWRPGGGLVGIEVLAGLDLVAGAPELAIAQGAEVTGVGALRAVQPRFGLSVFAGLP